MKVFVRVLQLPCVCARTRILICLELSSSTGRFSMRLSREDMLNAQTVQTEHLHWWTASMIDAVCRSRLGCKSKPESLSALSAALRQPTSANTAAHCPCKLPSPATLSRLQFQSLSSFCCRGSQPLACSRHCRCQIVQCGSIWALMSRRLAGSRCSPACGFQGADQ